MGHETSAPDAGSRDGIPGSRAGGRGVDHRAKVRTVGTPSAHRLGDLEDVGGPLSVSGPGWASCGGASSSRAWTLASMRTELFFQSSCLG